MGGTLAGRASGERRATAAYFAFGETERAPAARTRGGESRPRVQVGGDTFTLRPRSPWKGVVRRVNPTQAQALLLSRGSWTRREAERVARRRGGSVETRRGYYHIRLRDPVRLYRQGWRFRMKDAGSGVKVIVAAKGRRSNPLAVSDATVQAFLRTWHEAGRAAFERAYQNLDYDSEAYQHVARDRRKYIALDQGSGGKFLVDKSTGDVFTIKAYGVPNRRVGTLAELTAQYRTGARMR